MKDMKLWELERRKKEKLEIEREWRVKMKKLEIIKKKNEEI